LIMAGGRAAFRLGSAQPRGTGILADESAK